MKKLTITISEDLFRKIETMGTLFPWMVTDSPDYGNLIEDRAGWIFDDQIENSEQLEGEIENIEFESVASATAMLARYAEHVDEESRNEHRLFQKGDSWRIRFFVSDSFYIRLWDTCHTNGWDFEGASQAWFNRAGLSTAGTESDFLAFVENLKGQSVKEAA